MGKFNTNAGSGKTSKLRQLMSRPESGVTLPVEPVVDAVGEVAPITQTGEMAAAAPARDNPVLNAPAITEDYSSFNRSAMDPSVNLRRSEDLPLPPEEVSVEQQDMLDYQAQDRNRVANLRDRAVAPEPVVLNRQAVASGIVDGGIFNRANQMADSAKTGTLVPPQSLRNTAGFPLAEEGASGVEIADAVAATREGSVQAAFNRVGAIDNTDPRNPVIDLDMIKAGSIVTEHMLMTLSEGDTNLGIDTVPDPVSDAQGITESAVASSDMFTERDTSNPKGFKRVAKQQGNAHIGQQIALEYQRLTGNEVPTKIPTKEAETLGDTFKTMWAIQNPNLVKVTKDPITLQNYYEFTPQGEDVIAQGVDTRRRLFPSKNVQPAKTPPPRGNLVGDVGDNQVKKVQGQVGKQSFGKVLEQSMVNLSTIPHVVDSQRLRIIYATALPVLQSGDYTRVSATMHSIGPSKLKSYEAKHGPDIAMIEIEKAADKLAQSIQALAQESEGANYLTYAIQGFQGRISPQQSKFNPVSSKTVRMATRNAVPSPAKPGSRVEYNLKQMYAGALVPGADGVLPAEREIKFEAYASKLEAWGDRLAVALEMTDAESKAITGAIQSGMPLTDPAFPLIKPLNLDVEADAELIQSILEKGEDGPAYVDGLMDAAKYLKARRAKQTYYSYFNGYIDGKTNGIASNGIQMGNTETAYRTGVLRASKTDYLDDGDVRDALRQSLLHAIDNDGFDGSIGNIASELDAVATAVFSHREMLKETTMVFAYGMDARHMHFSLDATFDLLETDPSLIKDEATRVKFVSSSDAVRKALTDPTTGTTVGRTLLTMFKPQLESVISPEALAARSIMRASSVMFASMNALMTMTGPTGNDLHFGRDTQIPGEATETKYRITGDKVQGGSREFTSYHQQSEPTAMAPKKKADGAVIYGGHAYGGSVVGPVQALDAATVALSTTGKTWNRLKQASGGNPYTLTIYDAFKTDAMGYDVILEDVNKNWLDVSMEWSYLEANQKSLQDTTAKWKKEIAKRDPESPVSENEAAFLRWIMKEHDDGTGKFTMPNFKSRVVNGGAFDKRGIKASEATSDFQEAMRKVGYDWMSPPEEVTVLQLRTFVDQIGSLLAVPSRLDRIIKYTNKQKQQLRKEILAKGHKHPSGRVTALQYYAH